MTDLVDYLRDKLEHADDGREWRVAVRDQQGGIYPWLTNPDDLAASLAEARAGHIWQDAWVQYRVGTGPWRDADR